MKHNIFANIVQQTFFQRFIITVIVASSLLVGLETYQDLYTQYKDGFRIADYTIQAIFTIEILIRILAFGNKPYLFFKNAANVFDFVVTALFFVPFGGAYASVFRLIRILRVFRLVTALPRLQIIVGALIRSIPSMGYISLLMLMQLYVFAVLGSFLFGAHDPENFGNVGTAMLTLFQVITHDGWVDIMESQANSYAPLFFISFIIIGTFIILNLFIGVIINGFDEVRKEIESELAKKAKKPMVKKEMVQISEQLELLKNRLDVLIVAEKKQKKPRK